jgi:glycosyltransferase involved in cell wall biosynthesis
VAVVLPAFNEADRIGRTMQTIAEFRRARSLDWPIVLADDGSTDATVERARSSASDAGLDITVLSYEHRGKAATIRDAMLWLADDRSIDYLMMLDADDELRIDQLDSVRWSPDRSTIYIGRRGGGATPDAARPRPLRRLMSAGMRLVSRVLLGLRFSDTQCGFKLFPRALAASLFGQQRSTSWVFDAELLVIGHLVSGLTVVEVPVVWEPRGTSRVTAGAALSSLFGVLGVAWRLWTGVYRPIAADEPAAAAPHRVGA